MSMTPFFLTRPDLEAVIGVVERSLAIPYLPIGVFAAETVLRPLDSALEIPRLGEATGTGSSSCQTFLVALRGSEVGALTKDGRLFVDQRANPDSITLTPAGLHASGVMLCGRVATVHDGPVAKQLMNAFRSALRRHCTKIRAFYVGPDAEQRWRAGTRLTVGVNASPDIDLAPE
jgi:hypothetical protein